MRRTCIAALGLAALASVPARAIEWTHFETAVRGYPVLRDAVGHQIALGNFVQWIGSDGLHVRITYAGRGTQMEETVVLQQRPELAQRAWGWRESANGRIVRNFEINFTSGAAQATTLENGEVKRWSDTLHVEQGRTFAGFGFTMAAKALRERLVKGETVELKGIGFTPSPKMVTVALSYAGRETLRMAQRGIPSEHYVVHPRIPAIAKLFVKVPDAHIWLTPPPVSFLRFQGALAEPDDEIVRIDLM